MTGYSEPVSMGTYSKEDVIELFGSKVFNSTVMRKRLPKHIYLRMMQTIKEDLPLTMEVAEVVANAMKDWALEQGATHFTHWFQPMTGVTAEKHDAFISPTDEGKVIMEFSGKELIRGESDASSFPSGGLRATFEARGYTAWDPTSFAFVKGTTLYIPTTFISWGGEVLDKKTPLLRSVNALSKAAVRLLHLFGKTEVNKVIPTVGAEQEYFLIDKEMYKKRKDLILTGRTLFGAKPPKGQEMDDHYYGRIRECVGAFMRDVDRELWSLGIPSKTRHNEAAPTQHELAPVFSTVNQATDNNHLIMETLQTVANRHGLVCLLHEKPFGGMNGSGKHNNWSLSTDTGENLFDPGAHPEDNLLFLIFLSAVLEGVDRYPELLRCTVAGAGNDHRLGGNEAPPAVLSIFLGDRLTPVIHSIISGETVSAVNDVMMDTGIVAIPNFLTDSTDRNRTSPFAFTGNKFEFRMVGSHQSIAGPNIALNTIVAQVLNEYADALENTGDFESSCKALLRDRLKAHQRIIFNGNNYSAEWAEEAEKRGLVNLRTTPEAYATYCLDKNVALMEAHGIYTSEEMTARKEIHLEEYCKTVNIEARTMITMVKRQIMPAVSSYVKDLSETLYYKERLPGIKVTNVEHDLLNALSENYARMSAGMLNLELESAEVWSCSSVEERAELCLTKTIPAMNALRETVDTLETICSESYWPFPVYDDLLFYIR